MVMEAPVNLRLAQHSEIMGRHGDGERWAERLIDDGRNLAVWISAPPGTPPDPHIHPDFNEWWIALDGRTQWQIGQYEPIVAEWGDIIMAPAGFSHDIRQNSRSLGHSFRVVRVYGVNRRLNSLELQFGGSGRFSCLCRRSESSVGGGGDGGVG